MKIFAVTKWILITTVSSVLLLEAVLQVGALLIKDNHQSAEAFLSVDSTLRVLTVGDSHTYGLYLTAEEAYPAQLKKLWSAAPRERGIEVINVGFPGTNSSRVLSNISALLDTFKPDVIVLLVGINDFWTEPVAKPDATANRSGSMDWISSHSRVYKLIYMLQRQMYNASKLEINNTVRDTKWDPSQNAAFKNNIIKGTDASLDIHNAIKYGDKEFSIGTQARGLRHDKPMQQYYQNLLEIISVTQKHNIRIILMTYENNTDLLFQTVNKQILKAAQKKGINALELAPIFSKQCPDLGNCALLFPDFHPTAKGQIEIAKLVMSTLLTPDTTSGKE